MSDARANLEHILGRTTSLYTLPAVAMEVVHLTGCPKVDTHALKKCVETDPALTCKILRVVNSSLFGLRSEVVDLNQALALLGIKPLKLLVLGFSLPDDLFRHMAAEQLQWYWTGSITRAVAARLLSEQLWHQPGDEAFIAGLLHDVGILALVAELEEPYRRLLAGVIGERCDLAELEREALGFDHVELSAALLRRWQLPSSLIEAIEMPKDQARLARMTSPEADLHQILHLADLLTQLVFQKRLQVLPRLLEAGEAYHQLTKPKLHELVEQLQHQVDQLGEVLLVDLPAGRHYTRVLADAHEQMAALAEQLAGALGRHLGEETPEELQWDSYELIRAMRTLVEAEEASQPGGQDHDHSDPTPARLNEWTPRAVAARTAAEAQPATLLSRLSAISVGCRKQRQELSLLLIEPTNRAELPAVVARDAVEQIRLAVENACASLDDEVQAVVLPMVKSLTAVILPNCERRQAVAFAQGVIGRLARSAQDSQSACATQTISISAGAATVALVPKNFDPAQLVESAQRCLSAAAYSSTSTVKSIEL